MSKNFKEVSSATKASYETNRKIRKDWGSIKPVTKVIDNKRKKLKDKQDRKEMRDYE